MKASTSNAFIPHTVQLCCHLKETMHQHYPIFVLQQSTGLYHLVQLPWFDEPKCNTSHWKLNFIYHPSSTFPNDIDSCELAYYSPLSASGTNMGVIFKFINNVNYWERKTIQQEILTGQDTVAPTAELLACIDNNSITINARARRACDTVWVVGVGK